MRVDDIPTPALVVDLDVLDQNVRSWQQAVTDGGVQFRPHIKTHKTIELARTQLRAGACGITVAKVSEAEVYVAAGFDDIVIAYPVVGAEKWRRLVALSANARIAVNVESEAAARGLSRASADAGQEVDVFIDLDTGLGRCGVPVEQAQAVRRLADLIRDLPGLQLRGVTTYRGLGHGASTIRDAGREEGQMVSRVAAELGLPEAAAGSTPTGRMVATVDGISEVRAGTYVFNDLMQVQYGAADRSDCAVTIVTTVVSRGRDGRITVDGGSKTFSGDVAVCGDSGTGVLACSVDDATQLYGLNEEHGVGRTSSAARIGDRIAFHPAHVCTTVNLSDELFAVRRGVVEDVWPVAARGRRV